MVTVLVPDPPSPYIFFERKYKGLSNLTKLTPNLNIVVVLIKSAIKPFRLNFPNSVHYILIGKLKKHCIYFLP